MPRPWTHIVVAASLLCLAVSCAGWIDGIGGSDHHDGADAGSDAATLDASTLGDGGAPACDPELGADRELLGELHLDTWRTLSVDPCIEPGHVAVAAGGQTLRVELAGLSAPVLVSVVDAHGSELATAQITGGAGGVDFTADTTGEHRVWIHRQDVDTETSYEARLVCLDQCDLEATRYPIVLVHGAGGADAFFPYDYFYEVEGHLESHGYLPFAPAVTAMGHSELRAQDLATAIDAILAETGAAKVHLLGHSQAGLDFRVLLGGLGYGDRVASATSVSSPHGGYLAGLSTTSAWFGMRTDAEYLTGEFAALYPEDPTVPRFSWGAATCAYYDQPCLTRYNDEVVAAALASSYQTLRTAYLDDAYGGDNDGVVPVSATQWGGFLGVLSADHWDLVGQVPGQRLSTFDHLQHYLDEARRLRSLE